MADDIFDADWLALREPVDHRSRAAALEHELAEAGARLGWDSALDLGSGTGSNVRHLAPRLPWARRWTLVDHDAALLARARDSLQGIVPGGASNGAPIEVQRVHGKLDPDGLAAVPRAQLVTASALLDLVGRPFLERLVARIVDGGHGLLAALNYDGKIVWQLQSDGTPDVDPDDGWVASLIERHQHRDKGIGAALGPDAPHVACELLKRAGWQCRLAPSPWVLAGAADLPLAVAWLEGWRGAARELAADAGFDGAERDRLERWAERRLTDLRSGRVAVSVGHLDLLALPPA